MKLPVTYYNGNYNVTIEPSGKTTLTSNAEELIPSFPDLIDLKVTNKCSLKCAFCHEDSHIYGAHADLDQTLKVLADLPRGVSLAIGGGHPFLWPHLDEFLYTVRNRFICNITVNAIHVKQKRTYERLLKLQQDRLIHGIGISGIDFSPCLYNFGLADDHELKNVVGHLVLGTGPLGYGFLGELQGRRFNLEEPTFMKNILILGYKNIRRGATFYEDYSTSVDGDINEAQRLIVKTVGLAAKKGISLSFDNLAIEQLKLKYKINKEHWDKYYLGDEFTRSMYIDAVEQVSAPSSTSQDRVAWGEKSPLEFFRARRNERLC